MTTETAEAVFTEETALAPIVGGEIIRAIDMDIVKVRFAVIQELMTDEMTEGVDYGVIPGTKGKPTLLQPGAQKLCALFQLESKYTWELYELPDGHYRYEFLCTLYSNGVSVGSGPGLCTSMEKKYRWRQGQRLCPQCNTAAIIKGNDQYGGGWVCWKKKDGCGAKFKDGDQTIESQSTERIENPDIEDCRNTVLKMAKKRALVDATLGVTAASSTFTQDIEQTAPPEETRNEQQPNDPPPRTQANSAAQAPVEHVTDQERTGNILKCEAIIATFGFKIDIPAFHKAFGIKKSIDEISGIQSRIALSQLRGKAKKQDVAVPEGPANE